jgi:uncharacterized membrane protein YphA (DoxX/SURF4 family)
MTSITWPGKPVWPHWQKIIFRFFFIYFIFYTEPWTWINIIPFQWTNKITEPYYNFMNWLVNMANNKIFHLYPALVPFNGSGDTSFGWMQLRVFLLLAAVGCLLWSLLDRRRANYNRLAYWFRIVLRYTLIINCFGYGFPKLFGFQMPFPSLSQLSTPLGDYLPMRLSWLYMGYSSTYQFFAGAFEVFAGILLLFPRMATFGTIVALGVFTNVMLMNMGYDIPVKLFSTHLVIMCIVLLAFEYKRIFALLFNKPIEAGTIYRRVFLKRWMTITAIVLKLAFIVFIVILPFKDNYKQYAESKKPKPDGPIKTSVYEVKTYVLNSDTIPFTYNDRLRWKDVIIDNSSSGSVGSNDTMFRQRYGRGYFNFSIDSNKQKLDIIKRNVDFTTFPLGSLHFDLPDSNTVVLSGRLRNDSIYAVLVKIDRHFQLTERQFHWLSEYNR